MGAGTVVTQGSREEFGFVITRHSHSLGTVILLSEPGLGLSEIYFANLKATTETYIIKMNK